MVSERQLLMAIFPPGRRWKRSAKGMARSERRAQQTRQSLTRLERNVLRGLRTRRGKPIMTTAEVARRLKITPEQVTRIFTRAVRKLCEPAASSRRHKRFRLIG